MAFTYLVQMRKTDLAYIAGLMDGEGYISVNRSKPKRKKGWIQLYPMVVFSSVDNVLVRWLGETIGMGTTYIGRDEGNHRGRKSLSVRKQSDVMKFLKNIYPYLKLKRRQAELVMEFVKGRNGRKGFHLPYSKRAHEIYEELRALNAKGPKAKG